MKEIKPPKPRPLSKKERQRRYRRNVDYKALGRKGGKKTLKRHGSKLFSKIAKEYQAMVRGVNN